MTFIEAIAALEAGKMVRMDGDLDGAYYRLATVGEQTRRQLVRVSPEGNWSLSHLEYRGDPNVTEKWVLVDSDVGHGG